MYLPTLRLVAEIPGYHRMRAGAARLKSRSSFSMEENPTFHSQRLAPDRTFVKPLFSRLDLARVSQIEASQIRAY